MKSRIWHCEFVCVGLCQNTRAAIISKFFGSWFCFFYFFLLLLQLIRATDSQMTLCIYSVLYRWAGCPADISYFIYMFSLIKTSTWSTLTLVQFGNLCTWGPALNLSAHVPNWQLTSETTNWTVCHSSTGSAGSPVWLFIIVHYGDIFWGRVDHWLLIALSLLLWWSWFF